MERCGTSSGRAGSPTRGTCATTPSARERRPSEVAWEIEPLGETCRLTLTHRFSEPSKTFREVKSGWNAILSSLKSLLETGEPLSIP